MLHFACRHASLLTHRHLALADHCLNFFLGILDLNTKHELTLSVLVPLNRHPGTAKPPAADARCLVDADCAAGQQCDAKTTSNQLNYYTCSSGLDTKTTYGRCIAIPTRPQATPQQMCNTCMRTVRTFVDTVFNDTTLSGTAGATTLASRFNTMCTENNYTLAACGRVQAAIAASVDGNLARRTGALCIRLGECSTAIGYAVSAVSSVAPVVVAAPAPSPAPAVNGTNITVVVASDPVPAGPVELSGALDTCTGEGVVGGELVSGTFSAAGKPTDPAFTMLVRKQVVDFCVVTTFTASGMHDFK